ncbi:MAG: hypothetical protein LWW93_05195 [Hyphomicrobiales bacterium]|nr:hypothetical protein [Hyphomicrobiales bacterium]
MTMPRAARLAAVVLLAAAPAPSFAAEPTPNFSVVVTLSAEARADLTRRKEQVTVAAMYSGEPTREATKKKIDNEIGEVDLGHEELTRPIPGGKETFAFAGKAFDAKRVKWIKPGAASVLINVYSARKAADDNLLDCGIFQDTVTLANSKPIEIACKLIGE